MNEQDKDRKEIYRKIKNDQGYTMRGPNDSFYPEINFFCSNNDNHEERDDLSRLSSTDNSFGVAGKRSHAFFNRSESSLDEISQIEKSYDDEDNEFKPGIGVVPAVHREIGGGEEEGDEEASAAELDVDENNVQDYLTLLANNESMASPVDPVAAINGSISYPAVGVGKITSKERNRQHARNTRLRKKNYIESLKETIRTMTHDQHKTENHRNDIVEQGSHRKVLLQQYLFNRENCILDRNEWSEILEEDIVMLMPLTPYRSFPPQEIYQGQRIIRGILGVIMDTASLHMMLQTLIPPNPAINTKINIKIDCNFDEATINDTTMMCKYEFSSINGMDVGIPTEISLTGMLKAVFSKDNKLIFIEFSFDVMGFMQQLRKITRDNDFLVIPNTLAMAKEQRNDARIITEGNSPYRIVYASENWLELFRCERHQVIGMNWTIINGNQTEMDRINQLLNYIQNYLPFSTMLTSYISTGEMFSNWIRIYPLYSQNGYVSHYVFMMENLVQTLQQHQQQRESQDPVSLPSSSHITSERTSEKTSNTSTETVERLPFPTSKINQSSFPLSSSMITGAAMQINDMRRSAPEYGRNNAGRTEREMEAMVDEEAENENEDDDDDEEDEEEDNLRGLYNDPFLQDLPNFMSTASSTSSLAPSAVTYSANRNPESFQKRNDPSQKRLTKK